MDFADRQNQGARFLFIAASFVVVTAGMRAASAVIVPFLGGGVVLMTLVWRYLVAPAFGRREG